MSASHTNLRLRTSAAADLAWLLKAARAYVAETRPHVCCDCGHLFTLPSLMDGRRCLRCAIERQTERQTER